MRFGISKHNARPLLIITLFRVGLLWVAANIGYYTLLPALGLELSYNTSPIAIAAYFMLWTVVSIYLFWDYFYRWLLLEQKIWVYVVVCAAFTVLSWIALYTLSQIPASSSFSFSTYTDLPLSTPWYFVPKFAEVLLQQVLVTALVLVLNARYRSLPQVMLAYAVFFGGAHVLFFVGSGNVPTVYATIMTIGSILSSLVFPRLILRVKSGFVYNFMIHLAFYIILALILHTWPPPEFIAE